MKQGNKISISLGMLFSLLRQPNFNFSDIQVSRRHPVPKYEIRNILQNNLESKHSLKFGQFM